MQPGPTPSSLALPAFPPRAHPARFLTADLPGTRGTLKSRAEDFIVEELPAYHPSGSGEHLYLLVQKTGLSTLQMVDIIARHYRVPNNAVGYAGLKDKHAVTRQLVSVHVPGKKPADFQPLSHPRFTILSIDLHANKLRRGHLRGNRFIIKVRDAAPSSAPAAKAILESLARTGLPNRFGEQRFGHAQNNHVVARAMLLGDYDAAVSELLTPTGDTRPEHAVVRDLILKKNYAEAASLLPDGADVEIRILHALAAGRPPRVALKNMNYTARSFYFSSFQSAVFNAVLDSRLADGTWNRLLPGDLACKQLNGALFAVDEPTLADPSTAARLAAQEIAPSGPMWGLSMPFASGLVAELETRALLDIGVRPEHFESLRQDLGEEVRGDRRPLRIPLVVSGVEEGSDLHGHFLQCSFELPAGSFATVVMDEVIKSSDTPS